MINSVIRALDGFWGRTAPLILFGLFIAMIVMLNGCVDECKDQYCLNGGDCLDGRCICTSEFEGVHCENAIIEEPVLKDVMFWQNQNGPIVTVNIAGQTGTISTAYPGHTATNFPECGAIGCFNLKLESGTYAYTASSSARSWQGEITVSWHSCTGMLLQW